MVVLRALEATLGHFYLDPVPLPDENNPTAVVLLTPSAVETSYYPGILFRDKPLTICHIHLSHWDDAYDNPPAFAELVEMVRGAFRSVAPFSGAYFKDWEPRDLDVWRRHKSPTVGLMGRN